jgi:hypothetical protein
MTYKLPLQFSSWWSPQSTHPEEALFAWEVLAFPRRGDPLRLRVEYREIGSPWVTAASFTLRNPARGPFPRWTATPLPATVRQGDLAFTLTDLTTDLDASDLPKAVREGDWTRAGFRATRGGKPAPEWQPVDVMLSDATGNAWMPPDRFLDRRAAETRLLFGGRLCPAEPAWKLRVRFARRSGFAPEELWTVRYAPVVGYDETPRTPIAAKRQGITLQLGPMVQYATYDTPDPVSALPYRIGAEVVVSPVPADLRLTLLWATDEDGRQLIPRWQADDRGCYDFKLYGRAPVRSVNLTFAIQRCRTVEFVAAPARRGAGSSDS